MTCDFTRFFCLALIWLHFSHGAPLRILLMSPTLAGGHIFIQNNLGVTTVIKPGAKYEVVARNKLEHFVLRLYPWSQQESSPVSSLFFEGDRIHIRSEEDLYCVGVK